MLMVCVMIPNRMYYDILIYCDINPFKIVNLISLFVGILLPNSFSSLLVSSSFLLIV